MNVSEHSPLTPRQYEILDVARERGRVDIDGLAAGFGVTPQTIRKDVNDLAERGLLHRIHGGAVYPSNVANYGYDSRRVLAAEEKAAIGARAAALIPDNSSIILNIGTTTEQVAMALRGHRGIMAITNNLNVANILREAPEIQVIIAGGMVRQSDGGVVGEATIDLINQFRVDFAVIGASAMDEDGAILDFDYREVRVAQAIIANARRTMLVVDHTKFGRSAPVRIGELADIDLFVTDRQPPEPIREICDAHGVRLEIAEPQPAGDA
ncbi:MAG: DeoR/GlpR family DNA-binding transcription regulator [Minwuia sp.]|uniref:DeoR/GlpR family DNA-binding transcription regulator n=1 Tax=Minwuia sp. TaxID=2493630 RepID=UPI003A841AC4